MPDLGKCDLCDEPAMWGMYVLGCTEHKEQLKAAIENAGKMAASESELRTDLDASMKVAEAIAGTIRCSECGSASDQPHQAQCSHNAWAKLHKIEGVMEYWFRRGYKCDEAELVELLRSIASVIDPERTELK